MPWSGWQDGDTGNVAWVREVRVAHVEVGGTPTLDDVAASSNLPTFTHNNDIDQPPTSSWVLSQLRLPSSWATARTWFPSGLSGKVLGVDYDVRPDRSPGDPDQYVQYADGDNTATSTVAGALFNHGEGSIPSATLRVGIDAGTSYTPGVVPAWAGIGSVRYTGTIPPWPASGADVSGSFTGAELFPTTAAQTFTVGADDNSGDPAEGTSYTFDVNPVGFTNYQMPQWRYWIPDLIEPPLRQNQRHDGLGRSGTPRWSGATSRQHSNRWRGHL